MPIDRKLLDILVCPVTRQPVFPLDQDKLDLLNRKIADGKVASMDGEKITETVNEALITGNGNRIYRIDNGIPVMLEEQAIAADQLD